MNLPLVLLVLSSLLVVGCAQRAVVVTPAEVSVIRSYRLSTDVSDTQVAWQPGTYLLAVRQLRGVSFLDEKRSERFASEQRLETGHPAWVSRDQLVFGPLRNALVLADGRVVPTTQGLTVLDVRDDGRVVNVKPHRFSTSGWRPRPVGDGVLAQVGERMFSYDALGVGTDIGLGFMPEPQVGGPGLCWQETPVTAPDHWTGKPVLGRLFIRWKPGRITEVMGGVEARWTPDGRVVATRLKATPTPRTVWWEVGTEVVIVDHDGTVRTLADGARHPEPHPDEPMLAVTTSSGGCDLVSYDGRSRNSLYPAQSAHPRFSSDGLRLALETPDSKDPGLSALTVLVLRYPPRP